MSFESELKKSIMNHMLDSKFKGLRTTSKSEFVLTLSPIFNLEDEINKCHIGEEYSILNENDESIGVLQKDEIMYLLSVNYFYRGKALYELMLRRKVIEEYGDIKTAIDSIIKEEKTETRTDMIRELKYKKKLLDGSLFKNVQEEIDKKTEEIFNSNINCGGYALEVNECIFSGEEDTEKAVLTLLSIYSHIRLLGDTKLEKNEYMVVFRKGHHFIKIDDDGKITEKESAQPVKRFEKWSDILKDEEDVVFAVNKEHDYKLETGSTYLLPRFSKDMLKFDDIAANARKEGKNSFTYMESEYSFDEDEEYIYKINNNKGETVAQIIIDDGEAVVCIDEEYKRDIFHFSPKVPLRISNGELVNINDYRTGDRDSEREAI